jgi:hypothetical protein
MALNLASHFWFFEEAKIVRKRTDEVEGFMAGEYLGLSGIFVLGTVQLGAEVRFQHF